MDAKSDYDSVWFNRDDFNGSMNTSVLLPIKDNLSFATELEMGTQVYRESPISTRLISKDRAKYGEQKYLAGAVKLTIVPATPDTISLHSSVNRFTTIRTNDIKSEIIQTDVDISNSYHSENHPVQLDASAGITFISSSDTIETYPKAKLEARVSPGKFSFEGWGKIDIVPLTISYDSTLVPHRGLTGDYFWGTGIRASVASKTLALTTGYSLIKGVDSFTVMNYWQNSISPYSNPENVITITPSFGEWHGISASSSWNLSDTKPYIKSNSRVDFHIHKGDRTRHFYTSILLDYWSDRDLISYAGRDDWGKPVIDLGTKFTAEIKSFRLFMKMENLLNRNNSFVPGYYMPGLIFRWGFAWTITG